MRRVLGVIIAVVVVIVVARSGVLRKAATTTSPTPPATVPIKPNQGQSETPATPSVSKSIVPQASDPAVAAAIDGLLKAWEPIRSVYATLETKISDAAGNKGTTMGKGKYWLQKKGDTLLIQFDLRNELHINTDDGRLVTGEILVTTIDGKYLYRFLQQPKLKEASKHNLNYNDVLQIAGPYLFADLVTNNKLTLLPEEMKNDRALTVIKATPKDGSRESFHYFDKANGLRLEMYELDDEGKKALQIALLDININAEISDDQFKPVIPEGVTLEDKTK